jgi:hypothetical protein
MMSPPATDLQQNRLKSMTLNKINLRFWAEIGVLLGVSDS